MYSLGFGGLQPPGLGFCLQVADVLSVVGAVLVYSALRMSSEHQAAHRLCGDGFRFLAKVIRMRTCWETKCHKGVFDGEHADD